MPAEDIFEEFDKYGEIENLNVCDNLADHMVGSVYVKFKDETDAARAMQVRCSAAYRLCWRCSLHGCPEEQVLTH